MFSEALKQLPHDLQQAPVALRIRGRASAALGDWESAQSTADLLRHGNDLDREEAAYCYQSLAAEHFKHGRSEEAQKLLRRSIATHPEQREPILQDMRFTERFLEQFQKPMQEA